MKTTSVTRAALLALAFGTASVSAAFAQTSAGSTAPAVSTTQPAPRHVSILTKAEKTELKSDRDKVFAAHPDLKTEEAALKTQRDTLASQDAKASASDKQALHAQWHAHEQKVRAAMVSLDPSVKPVFAKIKAAHKNMHHTATIAAPDANKS